MPRYTLIGLCEPPNAEKQAQFDQWFVDQHIEDTTKCPIFISGTVYRLKGPHMDGETVSDYLSVYEVEAPSFDEAERILNEWQADPDAWEGRRNHRETMEGFGEMPLNIKGSGWYEPIKSFKGPAAG